jgi:hypothetical protein
MKRDADRPLGGTKLPRNSGDITKINRSTEDTVPDRGKIPLADGNSMFSLSDRTRSGAWASSGASSSESHVSSSTHAATSARSSVVLTGSDFGLDLERSIGTGASRVLISDVPAAARIWRGHSLRYWTCAGVGIGLAVAGFVLALSF